MATVAHGGTADTSSRAGTAIAAAVTTGATAAVAAGCLGHYRCSRDRHGGGDPGGPWGLEYSRSHCPWLQGSCTGQPEIVPGYLMLRWLLLWRLPCLWLWLLLWLLLWLRLLLRLLPLPWCVQRWARIMDRIFHGGQQLPSGYPADERVIPAQCPFNCHQAPHRVVPSHCWPRCTMLLVLANPGHALCELWVLGGAPAPLQARHKRAPGWSSGAAVCAWQ